jgi:hypothetical protein
MSADPDSQDRMAQLIDHVRKHPGVTLPEAAQQLQVDRHYLYSLVDRLRDEGRLMVANDRGLHLREDVSESVFSQAMARDAVGMDFDTAREVLMHLDWHPGDTIAQVVAALARIDGDTVTVSIGHLLNSGHVTITEEGWLLAMSPWELVGVDPDA